jgi:ABC-type antimicrobial peptide transport system permease subunit
MRLPSPNLHPVGAADALVVDLRDSHARRLRLAGAGGRADDVAIDPRVGVARLATLATLLDQRLRERRFMLILLGTFATITVVLASVGVFGVMSQTVVDRAREIGVRMVLGGAPEMILRQFLREALAMTIADVFVGLLVALLAPRWLATFLYEVKSFDASSVAAAAVLVVLLALAAAVLPTIRAARTNPARVLCEEA